MQLALIPPASDTLSRKTKHEAYLLSQEWNDYNLRWNASEFGGVKDLRIPPKNIWKPDVLMYNRSLSNYLQKYSQACIFFSLNSADEGFDGTYKTNVVVRHNGSCLYVPPGIFKSTCKIDITWFPFDDQKCEMKFGSWTYDGFQVILNIANGFNEKVTYRNLTNGGRKVHNFDIKVWRRHAPPWAYIPEEISSLSGKPKYQRFHVRKGDQSQLS